MKSGVIICSLSILVTVGAYWYIPWIPYSYASGYERGLIDAKDSISTLILKNGQLELKVREGEIDLEEEIRRHESTNARFADTTKTLKNIRVQNASLKWQLKERTDSIGRLNQALTRCRADVRIKKDSIRKVSQNLSTVKVSKNTLIAELDSIQLLLKASRDRENSLEQALQDSTAVLATERKLRDQADAYARKVRKRLQAQPVIEFNAHVTRSVSEQIDDSPISPPQESYSGKSKRPDRINDAVAPTQASEEVLPSLVWVILLIVLVCLGVLLWFRLKIYNHDVRKAASGTIKQKAPVPRVKSDKTQLPNDLFRPRKKQ